MLLVALFFMHIRHSTKLTKLVVVGGLLWLAILLLLTMTDYAHPRNTRRARKVAADLRGQPRCCEKRVQGDPRDEGVAWPTGLWMRRWRR